MPATEPSRPVSAGNGLVVAAHPFGALAGVDVLREGGTAMDAAVAAALVHSVVNPGLIGLGGDTVLLYYAAEERRLVGLLGAGRAPAAASIEAYRRRGHATMPATGPLAVTVPGALDGWARALRRYGTRSLGDLLAPAIRYAETGFPAYRTFLEFADQAGPRAAACLADGRLPRPGEAVVQPALAATLRTIAADGADALYRGPIGARLVAALAAQGGVLAADDLAAHAGEWVEPLRVGYRGVTVHALPPPSQGVALLEQLQVLEALAEPGALPPVAPERVHVQVEAARLALADLDAFVTDPAFHATPLDRLLSAAHAGTLRASIDRRRAAALAAPGGAGDTVFVAAADRRGNVAALMGSLRMPFGSGVVAGDTGILLGNRGRDFTLDPAHPNRLEPGKRTRTTLCPVIVTDGAGPRLALGCVGGHQQAQGLQQVLVHHLDGGLALDAAIAGPRWTLTEDGALHLEPGLAAAASELIARGHRVVVGGAYFGACEALARDPATGALHGVSDPRHDGAALGY